MNKIKDSLIWLFKQPENEKLPRPVFLIGLAIIIIAFSTNTFLKKKPSSTAPAIKPPIQANTPDKDSKSEGIFTKIKNTLINSKPEEQLKLPLIQEVSPDMKKIDNTLLEKADALLTQRLPLNNEKSLDIGRRDPMKPLKDESDEKSRLGEYDPLKVENQSNSLRDESLDYFSGMAVDKISLSNVYINNDNITVGDFSSLGGNYTELKEGNYINQTYYIEKYDLKNKSATLVYENKDKSGKTISLSRFKIGQKTEDNSINFPKLSDTKTTNSIK